MIHKYFIAIFFLFSSIIAMEKEFESIAMVVRTNEQDIVNIPSFFIGYSKTLKDMCEDFGDSANLEPCPIYQLKSESLKKVIELAWLHARKPRNYREAASIVLKEVDLPLLIEVFGTINYLDCKQLFPAILFLVSKRIHQVLYREQKLEFLECVIDLPKELQKLIQEILLKYGLIRHFISVKELSDEFDGSHDGYQNSVSLHAQGRYLGLWRQLCVHVYDIANDPIEKLGLFTTAFEFSNDGKYLCYLSFKDKFNLRHIETGKQYSLIAPSAGASCKFSGDNRFLFIERRKFEVETGKEVPFLDESSRELSVRGVRYILNFSRFKERKDAEVLLQQFPVITQNMPGYLEIDDQAHYAYIRRFQDDTLFVCDISNIQSIREIAQIANVKDFAFSGTRLLVIPMVPHEQCIGIIDLKENKKVFKKISCDHQIILGKNSDSFLIVRPSENKENVITYFSYIESIKEYGEFTLPNDFIAGWNQHGKLPYPYTIKYTRDNFTILRRGHKARGRVIEVSTLPFNVLMNKCTLKQLIIMLACKNNPILLEDESHRQCIDSTNEHVLSLSGIKIRGEKRAYADEEMNQQFKRPRKE